MKIYIAESLFGSDKVKSLNSNIAPIASVIFCYNNRIGFTGDNLGISGTFCNDFFQTPSDSGMCLTKNLDLKEILHIKDEYDSLFEPKPQQPAKKIDNGTTWGGISLILVPEQNIIYTETPVRSPESDRRVVRIQLNQDNEFPNMLKSNNYDNFIIPLSLKANYEYFIRVTPYGRRSSENLKDLNIKQRNCKLENEVKAGSIFKLYTENNCRYECNVKLVIEMCKCAPWDFMHKSVEKECDVFGRTCFYQTMENITKDSNDHCSQCIQGCDYIKYKREIVESRKIMKEIPTDDQTQWGDNYFNCIYNPYYKTETCNGEKAFVEFFYDGNLFMDKGINNLRDCIDGSKKGSSKYQRAKIYQNAIIVHLEFMKPDVEYADVKYTFMDKISNFGGKFGIFAQLTGWSLIGIINLCIVLMKCPFTSRN